MAGMGRGLSCRGKQEETSMRKYYQWFERTNEGRLIEPKDWRGEPLFGLTTWPMYETVQKAEEALEEGIAREAGYRSDKKWKPSFDLVLVACYTNDPHIFD